MCFEQKPLTTIIRDYVRFFLRMRTAATTEPSVVITSPTWNDIQLITVTTTQSASFYRPEVRAPPVDRPFVPPPPPSRTPARRRLRSRRRRHRGRRRRRRRHRRRFRVRRGLRGRRHLAASRSCGTSGAEGRS